MAVTSMRNNSIANFSKFNSMRAPFDAAPFTLSFVTIGGGGSGGTGRSDQLTNGGGGGAGAMYVGTESFLRGTYPVILGAGATSVSGTNIRGNRGVDSTFATYVAPGGQGAILEVDSATLNQGGSGGGRQGGGAAAPGTGGLAGTGDYLANNGGDKHSSAGSAGGGGGAGAAGANGVSGDGGDGGAGSSTSISGSPVFYAGGGGGGSNGTDGTGGIGGGGNAGGSPGSGTANTGGGGGGCQDGGTSGAGGSGIIILSIPTLISVSFSAGVTQTSSVVGTNTVYTITATSTTDETVTIG